MVGSAITPPHVSPPNEFLERRPSAISHHNIKSGAALKTGGNWRTEVKD